MTAIAVGLISFEEMAVSLLENWCAEMSVNSQKSLLIWRTPCTSDETEFERVLQNALNFGLIQGGLYNVWKEDNASVALLDYSGNINFSEIPKRIQRHLRLTEGEI